jgi:DNA-binding NarL/FixJ family response regulator
MSEVQDAIRVMLVDDHAVVRRGLRGFLELLKDMDVVGEAENGREALGLCRRLRPDLVLMDVRMPEMDGLQATRAIKAELPSVVVLVVTTYENPDYLFEALKAGAAGYILKDAPVDEMLAGLDAVAGGTAGVSPQVAAMLVERLRASGREAKEAQPAPEVSERERKVLRELVGGRSNAEIAARLHLSVSTVKADLAVLQEKLGADNRVSLAVEAVRRDLA